MRSRFGSFDTDCDYLPEILEQDMRPPPPNNSPEVLADGHLVALHVARKAWLSFFR